MIERSRNGVWLMMSLTGWWWLDLYLAWNERREKRVFKISSSTHNDKNGIERVKERVENFDWKISIFINLQMKWK